MTPVLSMLADYVALALTAYAAIVATWGISTSPTGVFPDVANLAPGTYMLVHQTNGQTTQYWREGSEVFFRVIDQDGDTHVRTESVPGADEDVVTVTAGGEQILDVGPTHGLSIDHPYRLKLADAVGGGISLQAPTQLTHPDHTLVLPTEQPNASQILAALNGVDNTTSVVNLTWVDTDSSAEVTTNFTELIYREVELVAPVYVAVTETTTAFDVENTVIEVTPPSWVSVTVGADEIVKLEFTIAWSNSQSSGTGSRYGEVDINRDGVRQNIFWQFIDQGGLSGAEYCTQSMTYYDNPGPGTYAYAFGVRAPLANINELVRGQGVLSVVYNPNRVVETFSWAP